MFTPNQIENAKKILSTPADGSIANEQARIYSAQCLTAYQKSLITMANLKPDTMAASALYKMAFEVFVILHNTNEFCVDLPSNVVHHIKVVYPEFWKAWVYKS